jgi:hypothetical protein
MVDLLDRLKDIERRAFNARREINIGREAGLQLNGISALRKIEMAARDAVRDLEKQTGAREGRPSADYPE